MNNQYTKPFLAGIYTKLTTIRVFETRCIKLYRQGLIRGYLHPDLGEEAVAVGACAALSDRDYITSTHRGHGHCIAKGASIKRMMAEICGKAAGYCKGRGGSMHIADMKTGNLGANGIVGAGIPIGVGAALGAKVRGSDQVTVIFFSDGACNNGVFAESLNLAAVWSVPAIFMIENNQYAVSTPIEQSTRVPDLYRRAEAYGVPGYQVDGNDVLAVYECTREAVEVCRQGRGPVLIEAKTFRHSGHHINDAGAYMPKDKLDFYLAKDPVACTRRLLIDRYGFSEAEISAIEAEAEREIEEAVQLASSAPEPSVAEFLEDIACL